MIFRIERENGVLIGIHFCFVIGKWDDEWIYMEAGTTNGKPWYHMMIPSDEILHPFSSYPSEFIVACPD